MTPEQEKFNLFRIRHFQDGSAFNTLFREYAPRIERYAKSKLPSSTDADDICSQTWMSLWNYAQSTEIDSFVAVALTIARNNIATFYKQREKRGEIVADDYVMDTHSSNLHESMIDEIDAKTVQEYFMELAEEAAQIMTLRYLDGFSVKDIAKQMGKTENTVSVSIYRSSKKIRDLIEQRFGKV